MKINVDRDSLSLKLNIAGLNPKAISYAKEDDVKMASGTIEFSPLNNNLLVHTCDLIEANNTSSSVSLNPSISIIMLLEGEINYQLGSERYRFYTNKNKPLIIVNILTQPEIFTRFIIKDHKVKKANVFCPKHWLKERCIAPKDVLLLNNIFNGPNKVIHWQAKPQIQALANQLLALKKSASLINGIEKELIALEVLSYIMNQLNEKYLMGAIKTNCPVTKVVEDNYLVDTIDRLLDENLSLQEIASKLAMSISTLQRKFKLQYKITVIKYLRQRKLNQSRSHLLVDGLTIGEAAFLAGYKHTSNFNHAFKQQFNVTPSEFMQNHKR